MSVLPSFTVQTILESVPGQNVDSGECIIENTSSKYYTPAQFKSAKLSKHSFSIIHVNIASLSKHIDELRCLLSLLDHEFDVIAITETRLHDTPLLNLDIEGYEFIHTPTESQCGGAGLYIKTGNQYKQVESLSTSTLNISESIFIELSRKSCKNLIIGCIYRHHTPINSFLDNFFNGVLEKLSKESTKICALLGDFNVNLLNYSTHNDTSEFYDTISSYGYRPLILQPTRVTTSTATLIDNIFINDIGCSSTGGNITSSISDHFFQFSQIDCFDKPVSHKYTKYSRNFRNFSQHEFADELRQINWSDVLNKILGTEKMTVIFSSR